MATNVIVRRKFNESDERLLRRFIKKVKKEKVLEIYRERTSYYVSPSIKKKIKQRKARSRRQQLERKLNKRK